MAKPLRKITGREHLEHNKNLIDKRLEGSNETKTLAGYNTETPPAGMGPKEEGGKEFVRKHTISKIADRNGNGDEVFNASNMSSHRDNIYHGYKPGEDKKVYETADTPIQNPPGISASNATKKRKVTPNKGALWFLKF